MCRNSDKSINHFLNECSKMTQKEYKCRRDWMERKIHWEVCRTYDLDMKTNLYKHEP